MAVSASGYARSWEVVIDERREQERSGQSGSSDGAVEPATSPSHVQLIASAAEAALTLLLDAKGRLLHCSPALAARLGVPASGVRVGELLTALPVAEGVDPLDLRRLADAAAQVQVEPSGEPLIFCLTDAKRGRRIFEVDLLGMPDADAGRLLHFRDVTDRWYRLTALREHEQRFRTIAEATRDVVTETDASGHFTFVSAACRSVLGFEPEELVGTNPVGLTHEADLPRFREDISRGLRTGQPFRAAPHRLRCKDGSWLWVEATGIVYRRPDGERRMIGVARDISDRLNAAEARVELESRILGTQKLESLGILAGGIAHDFNNLLTPILGNAGIIAMDLPEDSPSLAQVEGIRVAAQRAAALTDQMLAYAGQGMFQAQDVDVSQVVQEMALLLESTARRHALLELQLEARVPHIRADASQVGQVVMNLVTNAAESLPTGGGQVVVRTGTTTVTRADLDGCVLGAERDPGRYVSIEVRDTGDGLDPATRERMFDPFFTTKFTGRGLGLATVLGIVQGHSGAIRVESTAGQGTCFEILLPIGAEPLSTAERTIAHPREGQGDLSGQRVAVVDDDAGSLEWTSVILERAGMEVYAFSGGSEALAWMKTDAEPIGAAVVDYLMPEMNGAAVLRGLRAIQPDLPVVFVSGFAQDHVVEELVTLGGVAVLQKPCTASDVLSAIDGLIGSRPPA